MAPPTKKQKLHSAHRYLDLTKIADKQQNLTENLNSILSETGHGLPSAVVALLCSVQESLSKSADEVIKLNYQASKVSLQEAKDFAGLDYEFVLPEYLWSLKEDQDGLSKSLSDWADVAIGKLLRSEYARKFRPESITRTMFDILLCDRLELLNDAAAHKRLRIIPEAPMEISRTSGSINKTISGRADWALGYMDEKDKLQEMLVVIEAKAPGNIGAAIPQLLTYLACVQDARYVAKKTNKVVFGLATDSIQFQFAVIRESRKVFVSKTLHWYGDKNVIVAFLDHILRHAIESSPNTTPTRFGNTRIEKFDKSLETTYNFNDKQRDDGNDTDKVEDDSEDDVWKVIEIGQDPDVEICE